MWFDDISDTIGNTPLVRLKSIAAALPATVLTKVEYFNPGGSVKDRIGLAMIEAAEESGALRPGGTVIEGTSGNTGAALALAAISRGYRCVFATTDKQSREKLDVLRALGAEVIVCPTNVDSDDPKSYYSVCRRLASEIPHSLYVNQYDNPANRQAHYASTGPEIWTDTDGRVTHFVAGAGTGGTISGTAHYLKERNPSVQVIGVDPSGSIYYRYFHTRELDEGDIHPYLIEGVGEDILAGNMDFDLVDDFVRVSDREAMRMTRRLAREEGLFCGQSSGMAMAGALQWMEAHADDLSEDDVVVVLLPDSGFRYLSKTYNDDWMQDHGFMESPRSVTIDQVLVARSAGSSGLQVASVDETLGDVIATMAELGISQMPVVRDASIVGSLTESDILKRLIENPAARAWRVEEAMNEPFPVVPRSTSLDRLSACLERKGGAVLVEIQAGASYQIITKSDLISALALRGKPMAINAEFNEGHR